MSVSGVQVRAARAALGLTLREVAEAAGISPNTLTRIEGEGSVNAASLSAVVRVLEDRGIQFIPENGGGAGVRLRRPVAD